MIRSLNKIFKKILHVDLNISEDMPFSYLLSVIFERGIMFIRGFFVRPFFKKHGSILFVGKHVSIRCKNKICVGNCVSFQDYVIINALSTEGVEFGDNVSIGMRTMIKTSGSLSRIGKGFAIGHDSAMANDCFVGATGGVKIGNYVAIGQNVRFHSENHEFHARDKRICEQGVTNKGITVGNDVWIGAGAVILDGVHIGDGCVIGANTLVSKDVKPYSIVAGNPGKVIGRRENVD